MYGYLCGHVDIIGKMWTVDTHLPRYLWLLAYWPVVCIYGNKYFKLIARGKLLLTTCMFDLSAPNTLKPTNRAFRRGEFLKKGQPLNDCKSAFKCIIVEIRQQISGDLAVGEWRSDWSHLGVLFFKIERF